MSKLQKERSLPVSKLNTEAEYPTKARPNDVCYQITAISKSNGRTDDDAEAVNEYNTGLKITPPLGKYVEVISAHNLYKSGYRLEGPIIIEPGNTDELILPLYKYKDGLDLDVPFRAARMIVHDQKYVSLTGVSGTSTGAPAQSQQPSRMDMFQNRWQTSTRGGNYMS